MKYRTFPHGEEQISVIGFGCGSLSGTGPKMIAVLETATKNGISYFAMAPSEIAPFSTYAQAFAGRREEIIAQLHFGAICRSSGIYSPFRNILITNRRI